MVESTLMTTRPIATIALFFAFAACAAAQRPRNEPRGKPGVFDYYVLSLSWSPQYCAGPAGSRDRVQCAGGKQFGFVAHGLWPQYERGWPQFCSTQPGPDRAAIDQTISIMPSAALMRHEWDKHGTCSGLTATQYFDKIRQAYAKVKIPDEYRAPLKSVMVAPTKLKQRFLDANRVADASAVAVVCSGRFLQEVRVCLDKNLNPRACGRGVDDDCRDREIIMQPVR